MNEGKFFIFTCPHCGGNVQVFPDDLRCHIFRHGAYKTGQGQMDPHTPKAECDRLVSEGIVWGCGKPFRVVYTEAGEPYASECGYI